MTGGAQAAKQNCSAHTGRLFDTWIVGFVSLLHQLLCRTWILILNSSASWGSCKSASSWLKPPDPTGQETPHTVLLQKVEDF